MAEFVEDLKIVLETEAIEWINLIKIIGLEGKTLEQWQKNYTATIFETCKEMNNETDTFKIQLVKDIEHLSKKFNNLCKQFGEKVPEFGKDGLLQEKLLLTKGIEEYETKIFELNEKLNQLKTHENQLRITLDVNPLTIENEQLKILIEKYEVHIENLENEKFHREETFLNLKCEITKIAEELGYKPSLPFEEMVLSSDDSSFFITKQNMHSLKKFHADLNEQYKNVKKEISKLKIQVEKFWKVLNEDLQKCNGFREKYSGNSLQALDALKIELKRCVTLKKSNMKVFVERLQQQLIKLWDQCHCTGNRKHFSCVMSTEMYTEDLIETYEREVDKLNAYLNENSELFQLLTKFENLWNKMFDLEKQSVTPERYKNRGAQLLKEEQERKKLTKLISQTESKLRLLDLEYTQRTGKSFLTWGKTITEYLQIKRKNREEENKLTVCAPKIRREEQLTPTKSNPSLCLTTSTENLVVTTKAKRKLLTPITANKLQPKNQKIKETDGPFTVPKLKLNHKTIRFAKERSKRIKKYSRMSLELESKRTSNPQRTFVSYDDFLDDISKKGTCRSTLFK